MAVTGSGPRSSGRRCPSREVRWGRRRRRALYHCPENVVTVCVSLLSQPWPLAPSCGTGTTGSIHMPLSPPTSSAPRHSSPPPASTAGTILFLPADTSLSLTADAASGGAEDVATAAGGSPGTTGAGVPAAAGSTPSPPGPGLVIWAAAVNSVFLQLSDAVAQVGVVQEGALV